MSNRSRSSNYAFQTSQRRGEVMYHQYQKGQKLGEGGFAVCYKATRYIDRKVFAMKVIKLNDKRQINTSRDRHRGSRSPKFWTIQKAQSEARLLKMCNHPNIVRYHADFAYEDHYYLIMEYCQKRSLLEMLKKREIISQVEVRYFLKQMVEALQYLREKKIIHRDLKPANYLLTENLKLKIGDFGLATQVRENQPPLKNMCGTPNYISPEMLHKQQHSYEVDLWSVGVIMYSMLYGFAPFQTKKKDPNQTYNKIKICEYQLSDPKVSVEARDLISKILVLKPRDRITLQGILRHPFMTNFKIPPELSVRFLKEHPDQSYLEFYEQKKQSKIMSGFESQRQSSIVDQMSSIKNSLQKSLSLSSESSLPVKIFKKDMKKEKKETKQVQKKGKKTIAKMIKKFQKQEVLTSSPYSEAQSIYHSEMNKWVQYPSESKNSKHYLTQNQKSNKKSKQIYLSYGKDKILNDQLKKSVFQMTKKKPTEESNFQQFPSFACMLKKLSFQEMVDQEQEQNQIFNIFTFNKRKRNNKGQNLHEPYKKIKLQSKKIKILSRQFYSNHVEDNKLKGDENVFSKSQFYGQIIENVYVVEDFLLFSSSMHLNSSQTMKLIYCLKEEKINTKKDNSKCEEWVTKFIGVIFHDNSSIITKIMIKNQIIFNKSAYIQCLNIENGAFQKLLPSQQFLEQTEKSEDNLTGNFINLGFNIFEFSNANKETQQKKLIKNQQNFKAVIQSLDFSVKLKIRYAQDANMHFSHLIKDALTNNPLIKNIDYGKECKKFNQIFSQGDDYVFIKFFSSKKKQQKVFFQFNDNSKHIMVRNSPINHYQQLFSNKKQKTPRLSLYDLIVYNSIKKIGFMKKKQEESLKPFHWHELKILLAQTKSENESKVKKYEEDSFELEPQNAFKNIKNSEVTDQKSLKQSGIKLGRENASNLTPKNIITEICLSFREKMQFHYIRQMKILSEIRKEKQEKNNQKKSQLFEENENEVELKEGRFDIVHEVVAKDNCFKKL